jgi:hypothetical protein
MKVAPNIPGSSLGPALFRISCINIFTLRTPLRNPFAAFMGACGGRGLAALLKVLYGRPPTRAISGLKDLGVA